MYKDSKTNGHEDEKRIGNAVVGNYICDVCGVATFATYNACVKQKINCHNPAINLLSQLSTGDKVTTVKKRKMKKKQQ